MFDSFRCSLVHYGLLKEMLLVCRHSGPAMISLSIRMILVCLIGCFSTPHFLLSKPCSTVQHLVNMCLIFSYVVLDEANTHVVLNAQNSYMSVRIVIPKQYETAEFSFENASLPDGGFDSEDLASNLYWDIDDGSDECNIYYSAMIPVRCHVIL